MLLLWLTTTRPLHSVCLCVFARTCVRARARVHALACVFVYSLIGLGAHKALGQVGLTLAQIIEFDL